jgi:hypothetical protein
MINDLDAGVGRFGKSFIEHFLTALLIMVDLDVYLYAFSSRACVLCSCVHFIPQSILLQEWNLIFMWLT